jgi:hypothetical protein
MRPDPAAGMGTLATQAAVRGALALFSEVGKGPIGLPQANSEPKKFSRQCPDMRRYYPSLNMFLTSIADQSSLTDNTLTLELSDALTSA